MKSWKSMLLNNWRVKLAALLTAILFWFFIKHDLINAAAPVPNNQPPARFAE